MASRTRLIAGNWKMFKTHREAQAFAAQLAEIKLGDRAVARALDGALEAVICAPFTALFGLGQALSQNGVGVGAQNMHEAAEGAFTGEISVGMLQDAGCKYVILGHSERRTYFAESDEAVAKKTIVALQSGIVPIVCVGETLAEREGDKTASVIRTQMGAVLSVLKAAVAEGKLAGGLDVSSLVVAYEPIWAIGTGKSSSAADAEQVIGLIRALITEVLGDEVGSAVRILYGGSVKPDNIAMYLNEPDIDGALVGGASLAPASYAELLKSSLC